MILEIKTPPSPILRKKSKKIEKIDLKVKKLAQNMLEVLRANFGLGLSACQVGKLQRMIVIESKGGKVKDKKIPKIKKTILMNPRIIERSKDLEDEEEGCLSLPGLYGVIKRSKKVKIKALNLEGKEIVISTSSLFARILEHEIDHLDGILFTDKIEDMKTLKKVPLPYKIVFLGTPEFSATILKNLIKSNWGISLVVTEPSLSPVFKLALKNNLVIRSPKQVREIKSELLNLAPDLIVLAAYGQILPKEILKIPKYGSICLHPSLLPQYRGPSPIQKVLLNGEKETGVTLFLMDEKIDHGPILAQQEWEILNSKSPSRRDRAATGEIRNKSQILNGAQPKAGRVAGGSESKLTTEDLSKILANLGAKLLLKTLPLYLEGKIKPKSQNHKKATYTKLIKKEDGRIEKEKLKTKNLKLLKEIERKIRAFYPWPKVWTKVNGKRVIIHKAHLQKLKTKNEKVKTKLIIDEVQHEGKKPMKYEEYLRGNPKII